MATMQMRFDLRVPPFASTDFATQHRAFLEMCSWADRLGLRSITLSEHHGDPAGFTSAPLVLAAAVLGRTERIAVSISAALAPLHDPVRLAEQLATLDNLGPGRLSVILGAGYRKVEFEMAGVNRAQRGRLLEDCVTVCRAAWTGEPFEWQGRQVQVTPPPATAGGPRILLGGKTTVAARRAARLRLPFSPANGAADVAAAYRDESARVGFEGCSLEGMGDRPVLPGFVMVSEDPDATWEQIKAHALYDAQTYASWQDDTAKSDWVVPGLVSADDLRTSNRYLVVTPEECVALIQRDGTLTLHPLMGGIGPDLAWESLRLVETQVLPHVDLT